MEPTIYSETFYDQMAEGSLAAARWILPEIWKLGPFRSVVDVGCGLGTWLLAAQVLGAERIQGFEGSYVPRHRLVIDEEAIAWTDLASRISSASEYDLCLCLEVAEHLPSERAESLVCDLTRLSPLIAFSGAIPFQGGDGHVNEAWPEYWAHLFGRLGYVPWDGVRQSIWTLRDIPWWYRQNLLLFVRQSEWARILPHEVPADPGKLTRIHPESYLWSCRRGPGRLRTSLDFDVDVYYDSIAGQAHATPGYGAEFPTLPVA